MSDRYNKGSSRSTRDDSRMYKERGNRERRRSRSRSRSPRRRPSPPSRAAGYSPPSRDAGYSPPSRAAAYSPTRDQRSSHSDRDTRYEDKKPEKYMSNDWEDSDEEVPAPPPPPRISKISIGFSKPKEPIKMTLGGGAKPSMSSKKPVTVASVFNNDDDDEPEEMPAEARMRMRNIGRETPTSAGPNSFGKTKQGFCDAKKVFEKNLKEALETSADKPMGKFPQTIYKIKGP